MMIKNETSDFHLLKSTNYAAGLLECSGDKETAEALRAFVSSALVLRNELVMRGNDEAYSIVNDLINHAKLAAVYAWDLDMIDMIRREENR